MKAEQLRIDPTRLMDRLNRLAEIGATADGSCCRLALTDEDKAGRDLVVGWMRELGLEVRVDPIGNIFGLRAGPRASPCAPVMTGSHIDTVRTGGRYDGNLGVLGGLEVVRDAERRRRSRRGGRSWSAFFTDEEGARFHPTCWARWSTSAACRSSEALRHRAASTASVLGDELERIGYLGDAPLPAVPAARLRRAAHRAGPGARRRRRHDRRGRRTCRASRGRSSPITGQSNHAGTTPMRLRHDAGYCAAAIGVFVRDLAERDGRPPGRHGGRDHAAPEPDQRGRRRAPRVTVDLRNTDDARAAAGRGAARGVPRRSSRATRA